jgi:hypothetical protein
MAGLLILVAVFTDGCTSRSNHLESSESAELEQLGSMPPEGQEAPTSSDSYVVIVKTDGTLRVVQQNGREVFSMRGWASAPASRYTVHGKYLISGHHLCYLDPDSDIHVIDLRRGSEIYRTPRPQDASRSRLVSSFQMVGAHLAWLVGFADLHLVNILTGREIDLSTVLPASSWRVKSFALNSMGIFGVAEAVLGNETNGVSGRRFFAVNLEGQPYLELNRLEEFLGGPPNIPHTSLHGGSFIGAGVVTYATTSDVGALSVRDIQGSLVWRSRVDLVLGYRASDRILAYLDSDSSLRAIRIIPTEQGQTLRPEVQPIQINGSEFIPSCVEFAVSDHRIACLNRESQLLVFDEMGNPIPHLQGSEAAERVLLSNHFIAHQFGRELIVRDLNGQEIFREDSVVSFAMDTLK